ncbi:MAG: hypothetical protein D6814_09715 [Calditrichaeota bacterium]|nr:MAG: hypothetical protein D6814_09715 [Calditrichota bacterium]
MVISEKGFYGQELQYNNFENNKYHISFGTTGDWNLSAPYNWWGTVNPDSIAKRIFDGQDRSNYSGTVNFVPFLTQPVDTAGAVTRWDVPEL